MLLHVASIIYAHFRETPRIFLSLWLSSPQHVQPCCPLISSHTFANVPIHNYPHTVCGLLYHHTGTPHTRVCKTPHIDRTAFARSYRWFSHHNSHGFQLFYLFRACYTHKIKLIDTPVKCHGHSPITQPRAAYSASQLEPKVFESKSVSSSNDWNNETTTFTIFNEFVSHSEAPINCWNPTNPQIKRAWTQSPWDLTTSTTADEFWAMSMADPLTASLQDEKLFEKLVQNAAARLVTFQEDLNGRPGR